MIAGAVNSVAGGGTLITFPALLATGINPVMANATNAVALWPGQVSSLWGYRREIGASRSAILRLALPSLLGGILGAWLLLSTDPKTFERIVPFLILLATLLFTVQEPLARMQRGTLQPQPETAESPAAAKEEEPRSWLAITGFQFAVAIYGGYFGAGIGILMLAALGFMGFRNIHRMNGLKNLNALLINGIASILFIARGQIYWQEAGIMAIGSMIGGYSGAGVARRIGQRNVRRLIIAIGFVIALSLLAKQMGHRP